MATVERLLERNGYALWTVSPDDSVRDALRIMVESEVGALLVVDSDAMVVGIVSERDCARKVILADLPPSKTPVRAIMTERVFTVRPDDSLDDCMELMTRLGIRHLPVLLAGRPVGMISMRDLVREVLAERETRISQLEHYIVAG